LKIDCNRYGLAAAEQWRRRLAAVQGTHRPSMRSNTLAVQCAACSIVVVRAIIRAGQLTITGDRV